MSKIPPLQAEALGLPKKPVTKTNASEQPKPAPAVKAADQKPVMSKAAGKPVNKPVAAKKPVASDKKEKAKPQKVKMERDSFTMPKDEYAKITLLKARLLALGQPAKKSELLRAGIMLLEAMSDNTLKATLAKVPVIKTGRPKKK